MRLPFTEGQDGSSLQPRLKTLNLTLISFEICIIVLKQKKVK